jgi:UDP-N-acetylglucosamine diphosphorylase / glucose-1-phosphate thymidylyltransferase / UDP-N-acetylgalactosamine diphosphorylase / glucosamine-1-phosphate N-acetyltransferase / galactosamine-1-phosphate N-acetyltransferase
MKGILLAAGRGLRLSPLTDSTPKPLIKTAEKPILQRIIEGLESSDVRNLAVIVGYLGHKIIDCFNDGAKYNVQLRYFHQTIMNGTARAVLPAASFIGNEPFFLGYGDILVNALEYKKIVALHHSYPLDSIIAGYCSETPWTGGVLKHNNHILTDIIEKPEPGREPGNLINAGLMILQPSVIDHIRNVTPSPRGEYELTDALQSLARHSTVHIHKITSFWSDIGTHQKLSEADDYFRNIV